MIIEEIHIYTYKLPIEQPLKIGNTLVTSRSGLIFHIKTNLNIHGLGEAAPLKGLHHESLESAWNQLIEIKSHLIGTHQDHWFAVIDKLQKKRKLFPCVQFAIESAILNVDEQDNSPDGRELLSKSVNQKIYVNVLATGDESTILRKVEYSLSENFKAIKIKVGKKSIKADISLINAIHKLIGDRVTIRLDANRAWDFDDAVTFAKSIENLGIEYIEEPLKEPDKLPTLYEKTGLPIALDESLIDIQDKRISPEKWINAFVLKPSVIGSVRKTVQYIDQAKELGLKVVISDTFHSGVGLSFLIRLASMIKEPTPMGFDTYSWLKDDILIERLVVKEGYFDLDTVMDLCRKVDLSKLEMVG